MKPVRSTPRAASGKQAKTAPITVPERIAAYVRVSTEDQARSGLGLADQRARCLAMATVKGWPEPTVYADEGVSGTKVHRAALDRLMADIAAGQVDAVIVLSLDRLGRKTRLILDLVETITERAVLVSCKESFDTTSPQGQFVLTIFAAFSQLERDLIAERTKAALAEHVRRGGVLGRPPYGFIREGKVFVVDPIALRVVRYIFALRRRGESLRQITARLRARYATGPQRRGIWHHSSVAVIVRNRAVYAALFHWR